MHTIILAAGYATRLYPLTKDTPKALLQVGQKRVIEHILDCLREVPGMQGVTVVTNSRFFDQFAAWANGRSGVQVLNDGTTCNENRLGAVGDLCLAFRDIDDDVLVVAGDNLFEFSMQRFVERFRERDGMLVAVRDLGEPARVAKRFGVPVLDAEQRIIDFQEKPEKPTSGLASTAIYAIPRRLRAAILRVTKEVKMDNTGDLVRWICHQDRAYAFLFTEPWHDIGSPEEYAAARARFG